MSVKNKTEKKRKKQRQRSQGCCLITAQKPLSSRNFKVLIPLMRSNLFVPLLSCLEGKVSFPSVFSVPVASEMKLFFLTLLETCWIIDHNYAAWQERRRKQPHLLPGSLRGLLRQFNESQSVMLNFCLLRCWTGIKKFTLKIWKTWLANCELPGWAAWFNAY